MTSLMALSEIRTFGGEAVYESQAQLFEDLCWTVFILTSNIFFVSNFFLSFQHFFLLPIFFHLQLFIFLPALLLTSSFPSYFNFFLLQTFFYFQLLKYISFNTYYFCLLTCDMFDLVDWWICRKHEKTGQSSISVFWFCIA